MTVKSQALRHADLGSRLTLTFRSCSDSGRSLCLEEPSFPYLADTGIKIEALSQRVVVAILEAVHQESLTQSLACTRPSQSGSSYGTSQYCGVGFNSSISQTEKLSLFYFGFPPAADSPSFPTAELLRTRPGPRGTSQETLLCVAAARDPRMSLPPGLPVWSGDHR